MAFDATYTHNAVFAGERLILNSESLAMRNYILYVLLPLLSTGCLATCDTVKESSVPHWKLKGTWAVERIEVMNSGVVIKDGSTLLIEDNAWMYLNANKRCEITDSTSEAVTLDCGHGETTTIQVKQVSHDTLLVVSCWEPDDCRQILYRKYE